MGVTRCEKKNLRELVLTRGTTILNGWPRKFLFGFRVKNCSKLRQLLPLMMLKHMIWSNFKRQSSRISSPRRESRSLYESWPHPGIRFVKSLRTLSRRMIWPTYKGDQITLAYFSKGLM